VDLGPPGDQVTAGVVIHKPEQVWLGDGCDLASGVVVDARRGPVVLGRDVTVLPHAYLEGPLYVGSGSLVKAGACLYGESSFGAVNKLSGEIGESTFLDLVNKQHEGFIGHAYVGSWSNLGALTTCSDLKNTYGEVRVDLGHGAEDSGRQFVGLLMGEHGKTAIGTLFNTGTTVGFSSNVFGTGFPRKCLPCFTWGDGTGSERQDVDRAMAVAATVMGRRGCTMTDAHATVFRTLAG
jgi:UDP-N-acetylglucosamine diphosphorylase/glucosamine-1-phosphate N-acetyltransferase